MIWSDVVFGARRRLSGILSLAFGAGAILLELRRHPWLSLISLYLSAWWLSTVFWIWFIRREREWLADHYQRSIEAKAAEMAAGAIMQGPDDDDPELAQYESDIRKDQEEREHRRLQKDDSAVATGFQGWMGKKDDGEED